MKKLPVIVVIIAIIGAVYYFVVYDNKDGDTFITNTNAEVAQVQEQSSEQSRPVDTTQTADVEKIDSRASEEPEKQEDQQYIADKHYVVIDKPVATETGDKVEVRELFWYYCGHCYNIEPYVNHMKATLTAKAEFVLQPAVFSQRWEQGARFFYVLQHLGEVDRLSEELFHAIHRDDIDFKSQEDFVNWLNIKGVDIATANDAFGQYSVATNINKAKSNSFKYQIQGVPVFVINGKYLVDAAHAGSTKDIFKVIEYLIDKESQ